MKKLLLLVLVLGYSFYGFSQDAKYGVRGGLNSSNLDFDGNSLPDNKHRNGFVIGFFAEFALSNKVSLLPELQFSAEGAGRACHRNVPVQRHGCNAHED